MVKLSSRSWHRRELIRWRGELVITPLDEPIKQFMTANEQKLVLETVHSLTTAQQQQKKAVLWKNDNECPLKRGLVLFVDVSLIQNVYNRRDYKIGPFQAGKRRKSRFPMWKGDNNAIYWYIYSVSFLKNLLPAWLQSIGIPYVMSWFQTVHFQFYERFFWMIWWWCKTSRLAALFLARFRFTYFFHWLMSEQFTTRTQWYCVLSRN